MLYLVSALNQVIYISQVDISDLSYSITSPNYSVKVTGNSNTLTSFNGALLDSVFLNFDTLYLSGSISGKYSLMSFAASDGSLNWYYTLSDTTTNFDNAIMKISDSY